MAKDNKIAQELEQKFNDAAKLLRTTLDAINKKQDITQLLQQATAVINSYNDYLNYLKEAAAEGDRSKIESNLKTLQNYGSSLLQSAEKILNFYRNANDAARDKFLKAAQQLQQNIAGIVKNKKPVALAKKSGAFQFKGFEGTDEFNHKVAPLLLGLTNLQPGVGARLNYLAKDLVTQQSNVLADKWGNIEKSDNLINEFHAAVVKRYRDQVAGITVAQVEEFLSLAFDDNGDFKNFADIGKISNDSNNPLIQFILQSEDGYDADANYNLIKERAKVFFGYINDVDGSIVKLAGDERLTQKETFILDALHFPFTAEVGNNVVNNPLYSDEQLPSNSAVIFGHLGRFTSDIYKANHNEQLINISKRIASAARPENEDRIIMEEIKQEHEDVNNNLNYNNNNIIYSDDESDLSSKIMPQSQHPADVERKNEESEDENDNTENALESDLQQMKKLDAVELIERVIFELEKGRKREKQEILAFELDEQQLKSIISLLASFQINFQNNSAKMAPLFFAAKLEAFINDKLDMNDNNNSFFVDQFRQVISLLRDKAKDNGQDIAAGVIGEETGELDLDKAKQFVRDNLDAMLVALVDNQIEFFHTIYSLLYLPQEWESKKWNLAELGKQITILEALKLFISVEIDDNNSLVSEVGMRAVKALRFLTMPMLNLQANLEAKNETQMHEAPRVTISRKPISVTHKLSIADQAATLDAKRTVARVRSNPPAPKSTVKSLADRAATFMGLKKADAQLKTRHKVGIAAVAVGGVIGAGFLAAGAIVAGVPLAIAAAGAMIVGGVGYVATRVIAKGISKLFDSKPKLAPIEEPTVEARSSEEGVSSESNNKIETIIIPKSDVKENHKNAGGSPPRIVPKPNASSNQITQVTPTNQPQPSPKRVTKIDEKSFEFIDQENGTKNDEEFAWIRSSPAANESHAELIKRNGTFPSQDSSFGTNYDDYDDVDTQPTVKVW